jgi:hypothetical protein
MSFFVDGNLVDGRYKVSMMEWVIELGELGRQQVIVVAIRM